MRRQVARPSPPSSRSGRTSDGAPGTAICTYPGLNHHASKVQTHAKRVKPGCALSGLGLGSSKSDRQTMRTPVETRKVQGAGTADNGIEAAGAFWSQWSRQSWRPATVSCRGESVSSVLVDAPLAPNAEKSPQQRRPKLSRVDQT